MNVSLMVMLIGLIVSLIVIGYVVTRDKEHQK